MTTVIGINRTTKTTHTVEIDVVHAPVLDAHSYYDPGMTYQPKRLVLQWDEGSEPTGVSVYGIASNDKEIKRGFGLPQAPRWMREAVVESISEAKRWTWTLPGVVVPRFEVGETVRVNTPGESHHKRTGTVEGVLSSGRMYVDLGDVKWMYFPDELMKENK